VQSKELLSSVGAGVARLWLGLGSVAAVLFALTALLVQGSAGRALLDEDVIASMSGLRRPWLTTVAQVITDLGSYRPMTIFSIVLAFVIWHRTRRLLPPVVLVAAVEVGTSLVELLKPATDRVRPPTGDVIGEPVFDSSFPSGHTVSGTVLYALAALLLAHTATRSVSRRLLGVAGCLIGGLIGLSRVYLGYHWFSDVIGGWLLATMVISLAMAFLIANERLKAGGVVAEASTPAAARAPTPALPNRSLGSDPTWRDAAA
jgi:membrane-associated phospholipid phosphatase